MESKGRLLIPGEAVIEGYLVDHDAPHELKTKLSSEGIHYKQGETVTIYDPVTGEITNSELIDDELDFDVDSFNRQVITEPFNRAVLEEIAKNIDPESPREQGKTLIYAVNDDHADLIVSILKDIYTQYGVDNDAIMKITGSVANGNKKKIQEAIKRFKNEDYPSIVVTVDLLTTGIDVPSISTLVFMRRVKSRILFEQMLGRATRLCKEIHKTHFEIYDPVGVYDALEDVSTMKPVVANPATTFTQLLDSLQGMEDEAHVQNQINQVIAKLQRKKKNIDSKTMEHFIDMSGGMDPTQFVVDLQNRKPEDAKKRLLAYYDLFKMLQESKINGGRPVVISDKEDELISHTRGYGNQDARPEDYLDAFSNYVQTNINEIAALKIICTRPRELTRDSLKSLLLTLDREGYTVQQLNTAISQLTNEEMAADIISLIRRYAIGSVLISHEARIRKAVDRLRKPQPGERCNDPACGTFGFMISASQYVRENTDDFFELDADTARFEREEAFSGCELVHDTHRLALMNAMLHDIEGEIKLADTLSNAGKEMKGYDVVLTNPPWSIMLYAISSLHTINLI